MLRPIPVFAFVFAAYAATSPTTAGQAPPGPRAPSRGAGRAKGLALASNVEAEQFLAAWRLAPAARPGFRVSVGFIHASTASGFGLVANGEAHAPNVKYVWLSEIEQARQGFTGVTQQPPAHLRAVRAGQTISFNLANISEWMFFGMSENRDDLAPIWSLATMSALEPHAEIDAEARGFL